ncbi:VOC family protein [Planctomicrobium sp. SH664]|uniref:VOC family protein n=1 Tax=Planctomicrobium sp. SH664 TaxID=3448125 RepID=UPI003F5C080C
MPGSPHGPVILDATERDRAARLERDTFGLSGEFPQCVDDSEKYGIVIPTGVCRLVRTVVGRGQGTDAAKIVFAVQNLSEVRAALLQSGVALEPIFSPAPGVLVSHSYDPEGNLFSLESRTA